MEWFHHLLNYTVFGVEVLAYLVIVLSLLHCLYEMIVVDRGNIHRFHDHDTLPDGVAAALEFLMAAEVLKTMIAFDLNDMLMLTLLIVLRVFLSYVLQRRRTGKKGEETNEKD
ncbi:DUF1622 domain-containing protein [Murdochiella sp. Marseille-P8839]|nr:DUF1622 domain-containing protein [Murdochiella sp. Marseille-P8839]